MAIWMVNAGWLGLATVGEWKHGILTDRTPIGLKHNNSGVWGLINAEDREAAIDILTAYMVEHGDEI